MYDLIIIGGGPAGLSAGIYGARARLNTLILEKEMAGGQINKTLDVENYPGIPDGHSGMQLAMRMEEQAKAFGAEVKQEMVESVDLKGQVKKIKTNQGEYEALSVIITTGANPKKLGVPGEEEFAGRGVSYCATCDGAFYENADVFVVGGGDSAVEEANFMTKIARKVYLVHRRDELRAAKSLQERVFNNDKIEILWDSVLKEIKGDKLAKEVLIENVKTKEVKSFCSTGDNDGLGVFIYVGYIPITDYLGGQLDLVDGYIKTDGKMQTNLQGVYAAGDIRYEGFKQVVTAVGEGATAAMMAEKYLSDLSR